LNRFLHPLYGYPVAIFDVFRAIAGSPRWLGLDHLPGDNSDISADFFGVNVAPGEHPTTDDYIFERLDELGLRQVRMDYSYGSVGSAAQGLLDRLLEREFQVFLNVFPPLQEAEILHEDVEAQQRWSEFLQRLFTAYGGKVQCFEIGNTPNRGRWSGFSSRSFLVAWHLADEQAAGRDLNLAGPNVSDFEPLYNATYLSLMKRVASPPQTHTDNLFVERVIEPEAFDHRVLGRLATSLLKLNLVKKARILESIGLAAGCRSFLCTYTTWTSKRVARRSAWPELKQADYLVRYLALAASSGALRRVYWGPLICHRDGLIDDGSRDYPTIDQVSFYEQVNGIPDEFKITPAFHALRHCAARLAGARCLRAVHQPDGTSLFSYRDADGEHLLLAWCRDGQAVPLERILSEGELVSARFAGTLGDPIDRPVAITEHPVFIALPAPWSGASPGPPAHRPGVHLSSGQWQSVEISGESWTGACMLRTDHQQEDLAQAHALVPENLPQLEELEVLRDVRNRLWNVRDPRGRCERVTIKLNRVSGLKRLTYRFRPSKGQRHWNNACDMLRRGIKTPTPVAFYENRRTPGVNDSWYLCEFVPDAFSTREVYRAFRDGAQDYQGLDKAAWFDLLSEFVCHMHNKQVVHRDLSSGNLMLQRTGDGAIVPQVIDIGRAWIWSGPGSRVRDRHRLLDLIRICYKLDWPDREQFVRRYESHLGKALTPLWRLPFHYYDTKQTLKKTLKAKSRRRSKR
jgi:hypothetical protein